MKKVVALLLVLVLAFGMMTVASAAKIEVTGVQNYVDDKVFSADFDDVHPGEICLVKDVHLEDLVWKNIPGGLNPEVYYSLFGAVPNAVFANEAAANKALKKVLEDCIEIRVRLRSGTQVVDDISFANVSAAHFSTDFEIETIDPFVSVSDVDFEIDIYMVIDGHRTDDQVYYNFCGNFLNEVTECDADSVEVDTSRGQVAKATEYVGDIDLDAGNGVWAHIKMANSKKIYFRSYTDGDSKDEPIFDKYPSIEFAYTIKQVGMNSYSGKIISLEDVDDTAYIYTKGADGGLKLLGRGGEMLPFAEKYYVSNAKIDLGEDVVVEPDDIEPPVENLNPHTGR